MRKKTGKTTRGIQNASARTKGHERGERGVRGKQKLCRRDGWNGSVEEGFDVESCEDEFKVSRVINVGV
jgi:hypothetical protein